MELPGSGLFYALAALSMAFVSFTSIVVVLRQGTGRPFSPLHILFTRLFCEMGLMATAFAMLAPVLAICRVSEDLVWRISSAVAVVLLVSWLAFFPVRRKGAAPDEILPLRFYVLIILGSFAVVALSMNVVGVPFKPGPGPLAIAAVYALCIAIVVFLRTYSSFLRD